MNSTRQANTIATTGAYKKANVIANPIEDEIAGRSASKTKDRRALQIEN